jgi:hypothetical protein
LIARTVEIECNEKVNMAGLLRSIGSLILGMAVVAIVALALAGGICLAGQQCTPARYANLAMDLGFAAIGLGAIMVIGAANLNRNYPYQLARTASSGNILQRTLLDLTDSNKRMRVVAFLAGGGMLGLIAGAWLWSNYH